MTYSLRPYQLDCLDRSKSALDRGCNRQLAVLATGLGKAVLFAALREHHGFRKRIMVLVHREELADQGADKLARWNPGLMCGVEMAHRNAAPMDSLVVASVPTLGRRNSERIKKFDPADFDCIVSDECFPAGTLIDGKPIENILVGDRVTSYDESSGTIVNRRVLRVFKNPEPTHLVWMLTKRGILNCTANHPVFTQRGWINAIEVTASDRVMFSVLNAVRPSDSTAVASLDVSQDRAGVLFGAMQGSVCRVSEVREYDPHKLEALLCPNEAKQPHAPGRCEGKDDCDTERDGAQASRSGWQRNRLDGGAGDAIESIGVGNGGMRSYWQRARKWVSECLQVGHWKPIPESWGRGGRELSRDTSPSGTRPEEVRIPEWVRVDGVQVHECSRDSGFGRVRTDGYVYNLEVEGTHTYFANGILVHNCHHATSPQWKRVLDHFGLLSAGSRILSLGLTATPNRSDGTGLRDCFDEIVFNMDIKAGIDTGYLSDLIGYRVSTKTNLDSVHTRLGDFAEEELADAVNTPERNAIIVKEWCKHAYGKKTVAFTVNVQHALDLAEAFKSHVISAAPVWGEDPDRATKLARHRAGEVQVLCNCQVLTEGYDDPEIECIILAKPTKSQLLFTQMIGRGCRIPNGVDNIKTHVGPLSKDSCIILDVVDSTSKHNLITMPSLMGLPKSLDMKGERYTKAREQMDRVAAEFPTANIQDIHNLSELDSIAKNIELFRANYPPEVSKLTELAWRKQGDVYALPVGRDHIVIAADLLGDWWVRGMVAGKPVEIQAQNLAGAFNAADRAVLDSGAPKVLLARESRWRNEGPSDKQVQLCRKLRIPIPIGATRGMVSAALDTHFGGRA